MKIMSLASETMLEIEPPLEPEVPFLTNKDVVSVASMERESSDTDVLLESVKTMRGIYTAIQDNTVEGTINPYAAGALNAAVEHLCLRAGVRVNTPFCLEQLQGRISKKQAVGVALESISEGIDAVIRRIIAWIKKIYEIVYDDIEYALRGANAVARRAKRIQEIAIKKQSTSGSAANKKLINKRNLISYFNVDGKALSYAEIEAAYKHYSKEMNDSFSSNILHNALAHVVNNMQQAVKQIGSGNFSDKEALVSSNAGVLYLKDHAFQYFKPIEPVNDNEAIAYELPFGNASIVAVLGKENDYYNFVSVTLNQVQKTESKDLPNLTPKEVINLTKLIESQMHSGLYHDHLKIKQQIKEIGKVVAKTCDSIISTQSDNGKEAIPSLHFLKSLTGSLMILTKILYSYNGVMNRSMLAYCETSLSNWN